jgi:hypothetical protein
MKALKSKIDKSIDNSLSLTTNTTCYNTSFYSLKSKKSDNVFLNSSNISRNNALINKNRACFSIGKFGANNK